MASQGGWSNGGESDMQGWMIIVAFSTLVAIFGHYGMPFFSFSYTPFAFESLTRTFLYLSRCV
jgi:hypothetical protein